MSGFSHLREEALAANLEIAGHGLALYTWGNASAFDIERGVYAIKPSGVPYDELEPQSMVVLDLEGKILEGSLRPSSDYKTHALLLKTFRDKGIRGVVHTHSTYAVGWAQSLRPIPLQGTTHADHVTSNIPCTRYLNEEEMRADYETATGALIARTLGDSGLDPAILNMILVAGHGPFTWGTSAAKAVYNAVVLEELAKMAFITDQLGGRGVVLPAHIVDKHFTRKHGPSAYYGQPS